MRKKEKGISRSELHDLVWKEPLTKIAPRLGLLPRELASVCDEFEIPRPKSGYWSLHARDNAPAPTPLPRPDDGSTPVEFPDYERKPKSNTVSSAHFVTDEDLKELIRFEESPENKITTPQKLRRHCHPVIASTKKSLSSSGSDKYGRLRTPPRSQTPVFNVIVFKQSSPRAIGILNAIVKAIVDRGYAIELDPSDRHVPNKVWLRVLGARVCLRLMEKSKRVARTVDEIRESGDSSVFRYEPTGSFELEIGEKDTGFNKVKLADRKTDVLEDRLNEVLIEIYQMVQTQRNRQADEISQRRLEAEKRKELQKLERVAAEEQERIDYLDRLVNNWTRSKRIIEFVEHARGLIDERELSSEGLEENRQFLDWAINYANSIDPFRDILKRPGKDASKGSGDAPTF